MKDYYKILGVDRGASEFEIKKAYKELAKEHHPDHGGNEERFKEISGAYSVLSDDKKRQEYDNPVRDGFGPFSDFFGGFGSFNIRNRREHVANMPRKGQTLKYEVEISLYEAICGGNRDFGYGFKDMCLKCSGIGGINKKECEICKGNGLITSMSQQGNVSMVNQSICLACGGRGFTVIDSCDECSGTGIINKEDKIVLKLKPGISDGLVLRAGGKGGVGVNNGPPGDLLVRLKIKMPKKEALTEGQLAVLKVI